MPLKTYTETKYLKSIKKKKKSAEPDLICFKDPSYNSVSLSDAVVFPLLEEAIHQNYLCGNLLVVLVVLDHGTLDETVSGKLGMKNKVAECK